MTRGESAEAFGAIIRRAMQASGKTTRQVAEETGISQPQICRLRKGWLPRKKDTIERLARALAADPEMLWRAVLEYRMYLAIARYTEAGGIDPIDVLGLLGRQH